MRWAILVAALLWANDASAAHRGGEARAAKRANDSNAAIQSEQGERMLLRSGLKAITSSRKEGRKPTPAERSLIRTAEHLVKRGAALTEVYKPISRFGFRRRQTLLSLADIGSGHLDVTLRDRSLLDGLVVHHEYIDRETK